MSSCRGPYEGEDSRGLIRWVHCVINMDQRSPADLALTRQCNCWSLSIVRGKVSVPAEEQFPACLAPVCFCREQPLIKWSLGCGRWARPNEGAVDKLAPPQFKMPKDPAKKRSSSSK